MISFMSIGLGILADIDIDSEKLRAIGETRFTLYGIAKVFNLQKYKVRLSYKVAKHVMREATKLKEKPLFARSQTIYEEDTKWEYREDLAKPKKRPLSLDASKEEFRSRIVSGGSLEHINKFAVIKNENEENVEGESDALSKDQLENKFNLEDPVPEDWVTIEGDFISIYAVNMPYINSSCLFSPKSKLDDGVLWLTYIKDNPSRSLLLKYLILMDYGTHVDVPGTTYIPVTDLRIVPLCSSGKITVDGELIDFGPLQASVLPKKGRYMARRS